MLEVPVVRNAVGRVRPSFTVTVDLVGVPFELSFRWNARASSWVFGLASADGTRLADGLTVRAGSLLYAFEIDKSPLGLFFAHDTAGQGADPGRDDLGARVRVYFMEPDDL